MQSSLILASALAAPLCLSTAMAQDAVPASFHALGGLSSEHVMTLPVHELASVQGGYN
jgi:hypothetical protein